MPFKMHKIIYFFQEKNVPTLPKIFRPVTRNTLLFLFGLIKRENFHFFLASHLKHVLLVLETALLSTSKPCLDRGMRK